MSPSVLMCLPSPWSPRSQMSAQVQRGCPSTGSSWLPPRESLRENNAASSLASPSPSLSLSSHALPSVHGPSRDVELISFCFVGYDMPRNLAGIRVLTAEEQASLAGPSQ
eukprot:1389993-Pyramimonas_sp.AAC.1